MFVHNFKYAFKTLFRNKILIFWTFAFPILLGTFFNLAFSDIENNEKLDIIPIAIVENEEFKNNEIYQEAFRSMGDTGSEDRLFDIHYCTLQEAGKMLEKGDVAGYLYLQETPRVVVARSGIDETVFKYVTEEIIQTAEIVKNLTEEEIKKEMAAGNFNVNYEDIVSRALKTAQETKAEFKDTSSANMSYTMIEFYTLIAMTCLYGGTLGMISINQVLANMSSNGKRVSVGPVSKGKMVLASVCAGYVTQMIGLALLFLYTILVIHVDYGSNFVAIAGLSCAGSLAGLALGVAVGSLLKSGENTKIGIIISVTMLCSFFSGMMGITMKYVVDKNIPLLNKINPANMITDGFYALYHYDTLERYIFNIISLLVFAGIMMLISYTSLRRQKYDSI